MSALGQKQTYAVHNIMSALPPIATVDCVFLLSTLPGLSPHAAALLALVSPIGAVG